MPQGIIEEKLDLLIKRHGPQKRALKDLDRSGFLVWVFQNGILIKIKFQHRSCINLHLKRKGIE